MCVATVHVLFQTIWEGGVFKLFIDFSEDFPSTAPTCRFYPPLFHPNVYPDGKVCLSILTSGWKPAITVRQILIGIQELLNDANPKSPAHQEAYLLYIKDRRMYEHRVRQEVAKNPASECLMGSP